MMLQLSQQHQDKKMANTFLNKTSRAIGTTPTEVGTYTVAASTETTIIGLTIANIHASSTIKVDCYLKDNGNETYLVKNAPVLAGGTLVVVGGDQKVVLTTGDSMLVKSDTASTADVVMSILEIT